MRGIDRLPNEILGTWLNYRKGFYLGHHVCSGAIHWGDTLSGFGLFPYNALYL